MNIDKENSSLKPIFNY